MLPSLSLIIGINVAKRRYKVKWPWIKRHLKARASISNRRLVPFFKQSEENEKTGSFLESLNLDAASLTILGVT